MRTLMIAVAACLALTATASATEPELEARAILPADATWPAPFPGVPNTEPGARAWLHAAGRRLLRAARRRPRPLLGDARQRLRQQGELALVPAPRLQGPPELGDQARRLGRRPDPRPDHAARSRPQGPVPDRQRDDARAPADRRRLRHRVDAHRQGRHAVVRRGVRAVHRPHRRHRQGARRAGSDARRDVARQPVPARPHPQPRGLERLRGDGAVEGRQDAVPDPRGPAGRRRPARSRRVRVRCAGAALHGPQMDLPDEHRRDAGLGRHGARPRPPDRARARQQPGPGGRLEARVHDSRPRSPRGAREAAGRSTC